MRLSRRQAVVAGTAALSAPALWGVHRLLGEDRTRRRDELVAALAHPRAAARIGSMYLEKFPEERSLDRLIDSIDDSLAGADDGLLDGLRARVRQDYYDAAVVVLNGWILSRTELRLAALAAH
jgi:hypothetical protein